VCTHTFSEKHLKCKAIGFGTVRDGILCMRAKLWETMLAEMF